MTTRQLGFIGLGNMGGGMVKSLLRSGFAVTVHDLRTQMVQAAVADGATAGDSPADVAARSAVVLSSLPDPAAVEAAALGAEGIIQGAKPGQTYIDLSSIDPTTTRKVGAALAEKGVAMLDVPVGKGPAQAAAGDLTLMIGGDAAVIEACQDILAALGSKQFHCGPLGAGVTVKLINNLVSCSLVALDAEAMVLGAKAGLDLDVVCDVLGSTAADNWHLHNTTQKLSLDGNFAPRFKLALAHKDIGLALRMGLDLGVPLAMGQAAHVIHGVAMGHGLGDEDQGACLQAVERAAGTEARRSKARPA
jgi:3-hydroxyisobutyrate dehydrogenase-like beta-hydroxyacid dehydrogenase